MRRDWPIIFFFLAGTVMVGSAIIPEILAAEPTHVDRISKYEGPKTCLSCHLKQAKDVAISLHYQHQAEPQFLKDWPKGQSAGMMLSY
jgi:hypothetical protein